MHMPGGQLYTMLRQFLFASFARLLYERAAGSADPDVAGIAGKAVKEMAYHARHAGEWVVRLGDGTDESHARAQSSLDRCWRYTAELFVQDAVDDGIVADGIALDHAAIKSRWDAMVNEVLQRATLVRPADGPMQRGGRVGRHTEHLGHLLATMQSVARAHPGASW
jgi:ring-1,2-phenylacetyl-CoA epoxidase subunit PaaC